ASSSTTTRPSDAPLSASYLQTADVCLAMRIVARGLFAAGPQLDQAALVSALHRLPYIDAAVPAGTPKASPNQVVNEPVTRIAQGRLQRRSADDQGKLQGRQHRDRLHPDHATEDGQTVGCEQRECPRRVPRIGVLRGERVGGDGDAHGGVGPTT